MPPAEIPLVETTVDGPQTRQWRLEASACAVLTGFQLSRVGIDETQPPYRRVRTRPTGSFLLACLEGEGRILLEGEWVRVKPGEVVMAPPRVLNALYTPPGKTWNFAWLRYEEPPGVRPLVGANSPLRLSTGAEEIGRVLCGMRAEAEQGGDLAMIKHWLCLAHGLARRLTSSWRGDERLRGLWEGVGARLDHPWKLTTLAAECHMSSEHLRRICREELGRSPMEHLTFMRMQSAQEPLELTDDKIETIARAVGYRSAVVFSRAFARCTGVNPSEYRGRSMSARESPLRLGFSPARNVGGAGREG